MNNISLIKNKSKIFKIVKSLCKIFIFSYYNKPNYFYHHINQSLYYKIGYELAINNNKLQEIRLENKILHTEISKLKSNSRLEEQTLKYNMKFPKKGDIKTIIYE